MISAQLAKELAIFARPSEDDSAFLEEICREIEKAARGGRDCICISDKDRKKYCNSNWIKKQLEEKGFNVRVDEGVVHWFNITW